MCSRSDQVQPPSLPQAALVALGVHLPYRWPGPLLALLQPCVLQQRLRLRGSALDSANKTRMQRRVLWPDTLVLGSSPHLRLCDVSGMDCEECVLEITDGGRLQLVTRGGEDRWRCRRWIWIRNCIPTGTRHRSDSLLYMTNEP